MKIIKHGIKKQNVGTATCNCGCVFEYNSKDIYEEIKLGDMLAYIETIKKVNCPECGSSIKLFSTTNYNEKYYEWFLKDL